MDLKPMYTTNMITEQLEIIKSTNIDSIKDIEIHQGKFPKSTLYIKGTTKDDVKIDISGTYNYTSFDGMYWYYNKSETEKISIKYFMYDGYVYYNSNIHADLTEASITYKIDQFEDNTVPSMNYLIHNYATLTTLDEYATKSDIPTDYVNNDTLNDYVNKDTVIDEFMKEVELNLSNQGDMSYVMQLYNDENIRQAAIDNGIDIDAYLTSDSSITFKGHFDYVKRENNNLYFSNGTQTIYVDPYSEDSSCCLFYYNSIRVAINKISTRILLDGYTDEYANNVPSMKYINTTLTNYAKLTNLDDYYTKGAADEKFVNKDTVIDE